MGSCPLITTLAVRTIHRLGWLPGSLGAVPPPLALSQQLRTGLVRIALRQGQVDVARLFDLLPSLLVPRAVRVVVEDTDQPTTHSVIEQAVDMGLGTPAIRLAGAVVVVLPVDNLL